MDVVGNTGATVPEQIAGTGSKVGVTIELTVTVSIVVVAHWPAVGVKVYVVVAVLLTTAGVQVPVIPLVDVVGNIGATVPEQIAGTGSNVGVTIELTVTVSVVVVAHCPDVGVKVYVAVAILLTTTGNQVPVIPFVDINGSTGAVVPEQIAATGSNVGITVGLTDTAKVVDVAHWPASGVKTYDPLTVLLITAGDQVPVMPLSDIAGSIGATEPSHIAAIELKVGVMFGKTVISIVDIVAHCPASGVNVYIPPTVLLTVAGDHVPVIPLVDINGNTGAIAPEQIGAMAAKVGDTLGITVISSVVAAVAHCPAAGVKV